MLVITLKRCKKCVIPETQETVGFDEGSLCNIYRGHRIKHFDMKWDEKEKELDDIIELYRGKCDYDCLIMGSRQWDSTDSIKTWIKAFRGEFYYKNFGKKNLFKNPGSWGCI